MKSKFNLSEIMKKAWAFRKELAISMSAALKKAWKIAKAAKEISMNSKIEYKVLSTDGIYEIARVHYRDWVNVFREFAYKKFYDEETKTICFKINRCTACYLRMKAEVPDRMNARFTRRLFEVNFWNKRKFKINEAECQDWQVAMYEILKSYA